MTDQLRQDLEALYEQLQEGWSQYGQGSCGVWAEHGRPRSGCVAVQIGKVTMDKIATEDECYCVLSPRRYSELWHALGFSHTGELFAWNDHRDRTWDEVKERVRDAIKVIIDERAGSGHERRGADGLIDSFF